MSELQTSASARDGIPSAASALDAPLVLIADADPRSRLRRARELQARGFRAFAARTAFETIVKASCHVPELILLDGSLGDADLRDTMQMLATCPATAHIPVIYLTHGERLPAALHPTRPAAAVRPNARSRRRPAPARRV